MGNFLQFETNKGDAVRPPLHSVNSFVFCRRIDPSRSRDPHVLLDGVERLASSHCRCRRRTRGVIAEHA